MSVSVRRAIFINHTFLYFRFTVQEALDMILENCEDDSLVTIAVEPPTERGEADIGPYWRRF